MSPQSLVTTALDRAPGRRRRGSGWRPRRAPLRRGSCPSSSIAAMTSRPTGPVMATRMALPHFLKAPTSQSQTAAAAALIAPQAAVTTRRKVSFFFHSTTMTATSAATAATTSPIGFAVSAALRSHCAAADALVAAECATVAAVAATFAAVSGDPGGGLAGDAGDRERRLPDERRRAPW